MIENKQFILWIIWLLDCFLIGFNLGIGYWYLMSKKIDNIFSKFLKKEGD